MAVVNAWLLYQRAHSQKNSSLQTLRLAEFKAEIAEVGLCKAEKGASKKRTAGRPSLESQIKKARHRQSLPIADVRTDDTSHWPIWAIERLRCRLPGCNGQSRVRCEKCQISLCYTKVKNCFKRFYTE
nr:uncharacterized protein LOC124810968 [Hydra vulgaris]